MTHEHLPKIAEDVTEDRSEEGSEEESDEGVVVIQVSDSKDLIKKKQKMFIFLNKKKCCQNVNVSNIICDVLGFVFGIPCMLGLIYALGMGIVKGAAYLLGGAGESAFPMDRWYTHLVFLLVGVIIPGCCCCYQTGTCNKRRFRQREVY